MRAILPFGDRRDPAHREAILRRIRGEFREMPCLRLTASQAQRLFGLRQDVCLRVLTELTGDATLVRGSDGRYGLNDSRRSSFNAGAIGRPMNVSTKAS
jgi:hypothetical protein